MQRVAKTTKKQQGGKCANPGKYVGNVKKGKYNKNG